MPSARSERRHQSIPFWRRARRIFLLAAIACLIPAGISYVQAMGERHNVGLGVRSVEWLRQNGGNSLVSQIENWYYTLTAPAKGGPPLRSLPQVGIAAAGEGSRAQSVKAYRPPNVKPLIRPALPGEGVWKKAAANAGRAAPGPADDLPQRPRIPQVRRRRRLDRLLPDQAGLRPRPGRAARAAGPPRPGRGTGSQAQACRRDLQRGLPAGNLERRPDLPRPGQGSDGQRDCHRRRVPRRAS